MSAKGPSPNGLPPSPILDYSADILTIPTESGSQSDVPSISNTKKFTPQTPAGKPADKPVAKPASKALGNPTEDGDKDNKSGYIQHVTLEGAEDDWIVGGYDTHSDYGSYDGSVNSENNGSVQEDYFDRYHYNDDESYVPLAAAFACNYGSTAHDDEDDQTGTQAGSQPQKHKTRRRRRGHRHRQSRRKSRRHRHGSYASSADAYSGSDADAEDDDSQDSNKDSHKDSNRPRRRRHSSEEEDGCPDMQKGMLVAGGAGLLASGAASSSSRRWGYVAVGFITACTVAVFMYYMYRRARRAEERIKALLAIMELEVDEEDGDVRPKSAPASPTPSAPPKEVRFDPRESMDISSVNYETSSEEEEDDDDLSSLPSLIPGSPRPIPEERKEPLKTVKSDPPEKQAATVLTALDIDVSALAALKIDKSKESKEDKSGDNKSIDKPKPAAANKQRARAPTIKVTPAPVSAAVASNVPALGSDNMNGVD